MTKGSQVLGLVDGATSGLCLRDIEGRRGIPMRTPFHLAHLDPDEVARPVAGAAFGHGDNAVAMLDELDIQLARMHEQGYVAENQELTLGVRSVSVPGFALPIVPVAAITIVAATTRLTLEESAGTLLRQIQATAHEICVRSAFA